MKTENRVLAVSQILGVRQQKPEKQKPVKTRADAERTAGEYAALVHERDGLIARRNQASAALNAEFEQPLVLLAQKIEAKQVALQDWHKAERKKLGDRVDLIHGQIEFKNGPKKVFFIKKWTDEMAIKAIEKIKKWKEIYVRRSPELNRQQIRADFEAGRITNDELKQIGCYVDNTEFFRINLAPRAASPA